jgi:hypothetical protein
VAATHVGIVGGEELVIRIGEGTLTWDLEELHATWWDSLARQMR